MTTGESDASEPAEHIVVPTTSSCRPPPLSTSQTLPLQASSPHMNTRPLHIHPPSRHLPLPSVPDQGHSGHRRRHRHSPRRLCLHRALRRSPSSHCCRSLQGPSQIRIHRVPVTEKGPLRPRSVSRTNPGSRHHSLDSDALDHLSRRIASCVGAPVCDASSFPSPPRCALPPIPSFPSRVFQLGSRLCNPCAACPRPYISPFPHSPSLSSSSSTSTAQSTEPLSSPSPNPARLSRLLSSTFRNTRVVVSPARPTTAHLIHTARSYAHAHRPSSATTTSLYTQPTSSARLAGTRSRTSFYPGLTDDARAWGRVRDTFSTVTTSDTDTVCTVPHLLRAVAETSPFADPDLEQPASSVRQSTTSVGTSLGLKLRLSDASEHARYRLRERERERKRWERDYAEQRLSTDSRATATSVETARAVHRRSRSLEAEAGRKEFKLRDSESVLREIGW